MIICYTVPEIWRVTDVIVIFHFGLFFASLPLTWNVQKMNISKKWKNLLEISSFYTSVTKIMIICYIVPEIWHVMDVIVIFHFGLFLPFYPCNSPQNDFFGYFLLFYPLTDQKIKTLENEKKCLEISSFYICVP